VIAGGAVALFIAALATPAMAAPAACKPAPVCARPTPEPTKHQDSPKPTELFPASGQVQAVTAPAPTPFDDPKATPGPAVGTLMTPQAQLTVPINGPAVAAHPQQEGGLTALLLVGGVLALIALATLTFAIALR